jgi:hypothetical protein
VCRIDDGLEHDFHLFMLLCSAFCFLLFAICYLLFAICYLLFDLTRVMEWIDGPPRDFLFSVDNAAESRAKDSQIGKFFA